MLNYFFTFAPQMQGQKSILAYLLILLTGFSVFFSNKKYEQTPVHTIEISQNSHPTEQKKNKDTQINESHDSATLLRVGVELVVYNFFEAITIIHFALAKIAKNKITETYFARLLVYSFHLEHLFFGIIAPNAP
mgnify:CR=1 FL=1